MAYGEVEDAYQHLLRRLTEELPDLAVQLREEVNRGRRLKQTELAAEDLQDRQHRLRESQIERLGRQDVAMVPYTEGERVELTLDVITTQAKAMYGARKVILAMIEGHGIESRSVVFAEPEGTAQETIPLSDEVTRTADMCGSILSLLRPTESPESGEVQ